jgi:hypothetical protein
MSLSQLGKSTSEIEVTNISGHGIWLLARGVEHFLSYDNFPWFRDKTVNQIFNVEEPSPGHYYWPELDIDLSEKIIRDPQAFPLQARNTQPHTRQAKRR